MNRGVFPNNMPSSDYEIGEVVFSISSPGPGWLKADGTIYSKETRNGRFYVRESSLRRLGEQHAAWRLDSDVLLNYGTATDINTVGTNGTIFAIGGNAGGLGNRVRFTSDFGRTWNSSFISGFTTTSNITAIRNNNGIWLVSGGSAIATATTLNAGGTDFNVRSSGLVSITEFGFGNSIHVAAGASGQLLSSTDAITWTARTSNFGTTRITGVAFGNNVWAAVGYYGQIRSSTDAITWTTRTSNTVSHINTLAFGNGVFVGAMQLGQIITSTDAITWTRRTPTPFSGQRQGREIVFANNKFYAVMRRPGSNGTDGSVIQSADGITWGSFPNFASVPPNNPPFDIAASRNGIMVTCSGGQLARASFSERQFSIGSSSVPGWVRYE